ncbi:MAG: spermidine/putrescine ABC transporter substrate-binding protein [Bryobacterales bacterium]|nr:spermidine/putrescine ABC transporter substrate-binding protein [Bryobacterales bacterium]
MRKFSRRSLLSAAAAATLGFAGGCGRNGGETLYVMDWAHYIPVRVLQLFERESGIRVRYQAYGSNDEMLRRLALAELPWDVAFPCQQHLQAMRRRKLLQPLDHAKLPNLSSLSADFAKPFWDPRLEFSVPVSWGCTGIAYSRQLQMKIGKWADLWDERLRERLTMLNDRDEVLAASLLKLGLSLNSSHPEHLRAAGEEALRQKRLVHSYGTLESKNRLLSGEFQVAQLWSNLAGQAIAAAPNIEFVFPEEGFPVYAENAVVLNTALNSVAAHSFINFLLVPEVAAMLSEFAYTPSTVEGTRKFLPLRLREDPLLFMDPAMLARGQWFKPQETEAQARRQLVWQQILAA